MTLPNLYHRSKKKNQEDYDVPTKKCVRRL
jgi:hypothetical protein